MRLISLFVALLLAGCATTGTVTQQQAAIENVLLALAGQAAGVYLGGTCNPPPIPAELLNPCQPQPANATQQQLQDALTTCITSTAVLIAVAKYQQKVCTPTAKTQ